MTVKSKMLLCHFENIFMEGSPLKSYKISARRSCHHHNTKWWSSGQNSIIQIWNTRILLQFQRSTVWRSAGRCSKVNSFCNYTELPTIIIRTFEDFEQLSKNNHGKVYVMPSGKVTPVHIKICCWIRIKAARIVCS